MFYVGRIFIIMVVVFALAGCADISRTPLTQPLDFNRQTDADDDGKEIVPGSTAQARERITYGDGPEVPLSVTMAEPYSSATPPPLSGENIGINFNGVSLAAFVNTVFNEILGVSFEIDGDVLDREQLVTLRTADTMPPDEFFELVVQVLENYDISVVYQGGVYRIIERDRFQRDIPRIIRSRTFPSVPANMRPIFYYASVHNVQASILRSWMELALGDRINVLSVPNANAMLLLGRAEDVEAALETITILDQPHLAGNRSVKISPAFWSAERLVDQLVEVLTAEGYFVSRGTGSAASIKLVAVQALNIIVAFSSSEANLQHVVRWAAELDQPSQTIDTRGVYYYQVQNTNAEEVADIIDELLGFEAEAPSSDMGQAVAASGLKLIVDASRNAILFQGTAEEYAQFSLLMEQMDRAPLEVLIEATVAEVTLDEGQSLGVIFDFDDGTEMVSNASAILSDEGLMISLIRDTGDFAATINALVDQQRVSILSSPRLVTSSGSTASMQVGTQVPIVTTQQTAPEGTVAGTSNILQSIQYRNTGVILTIEPTINSSRRVELSVSQEVSDAQSNNTSDIQSPIILTRSISTTLALDDGETVLLGGLISENYSVGEAGVPLLKDIPVIGSLFKNQSQNVTKTELIVLLTPYIIDGPETSRAVRDAFKAQLGDWANQQETPSSTSHAFQ